MGLDYYGRGYSRLEDALDNFLSKTPEEIAQRHRELEEAGFSTEVAWHLLPDLDLEHDQAQHDILEEYLEKLGEAKEKAELDFRITYLRQKNGSQTWYIHIKRWKQEE